MNTFKKLTALLIAFLMLIAQVPTFAESTPEFAAQTVIKRTPFEAPRFVLPIKDKTTLFADTLETKMSDAADELREAMTRNESYVTVRIDDIDKYVDLDDLFKAEEKVEEFLSDLSDNILTMAMAHTGKADEGDYIYWRLSRIGMGGGIDYDDRKNCEYAYFYYIIGYYTTAEQEAKVAARVAEVLEELDLEGDSDYVKVKKIYDWICGHVKYDNEHLSDPNYELQFTAYAALIQGRSVCQGYASLLYRMLLSCNVDCRLISGTGYSGNTSGPHAWNIVKIGGKYYNLDPTWDAGAKNYSFFLLNSKSFLDHKRDHEYATSDFNAEYPMADKNYTPTEDDFLKRIDVAYDYIGKIDAKMTNDEAAAIIVTIIDKAVLPESISCYYTENGAFKRAGASISENTITFDVKREYGGMIFIWDKYLRPLVKAIK